jgi:ornithine cyclodeaminase
MRLPYVDAAEVARRLGPAGAFDALKGALLAGLDPEGDPPRALLDVEGGHLLVMPSVAAGHPIVKLVTVGGDPRVQGICVVFDVDTLAPVALVDAIALTNLRTAAVSALAIDRLAPPDVTRLLVFGRGPQAHAHVEAVRRIRRIEHVAIVGRDHDGIDVERLVSAADVICCCTTAREALFDGTLVADRATIVAIGSHETDVRETDGALAARSTVVVESRASALREAGDVVLAIDEGALDPDRIVTLAELVRGDAVPDPRRPRLFKSTGMSWEDAVVAAAVLRSARHGGAEAP